MRLAKKFLWACGFFLPLLFVGVGSVSGAVVVDDYTPEVTARVVRISFIRGDVQVRRTDADGVKTDWERAALNLPLVEGDELSTGKGAVVEIQLDSSNHIRLWENAYLKLTTLRDEGVAVSLPQGTMSFRARAFDKNKSYFEADAPGTTVSVERAGMYRIDAGAPGGAEIRVAAIDGGEAKVYTQSAGFTLREGRAARIFIDGNYAGDYETVAAVAGVADEFDQWVLQRDSIIAKRLNEAFYDKYYDRDQFGAEDLNEHGEWIYTKKYGYVWKPYPGALANYADWSPYRYGHWRWVPFYGWTWVNDEPWGWATYHHGRWVWDGGYWVWCPYPYARWRRSWWQPAHVSIVTWNGRVLWFPLGYNDDYCDFNRGFGGYRRGGRRNNVTIINNTTVIVNPAPNPTNPNPNPSPIPPVLTPAQINEIRRTNANTPTLQRIPFEAVVGVNAEEFGKQTRGIRTAPLAEAKQALAKPITEQEPPPILPGYQEIKGKMSREILIENPRIAGKQEEQVKTTGASQREAGKALNQKLENERIFGNRQPRVIEDIKTDAETKTDPNEPRRTGAVNRRAPPVKQEDSEQNAPQTPTWNPNPTFPARPTGKKPDNRDEPQNTDEPVRTRNRKDDEPVRPVKQREENQTPPIFVNPAPQPQPKQEEKPPQEEERRRPQPTFPRQEERREETPRPKPEPRREEPRPQPKPEPKEEAKPSKPSIIERKSAKEN